MADKKHIRTFRSKKLHPEHIKLLNEAIRKNAKGGDHNVHISYTKADGSKSDRRVRPLAVKGKSLFVAHCHKRNAIRSFKVERIDMIKKAFWDGFEKRAKVSLEDVERRMGTFIKPKHLSTVEGYLDDAHEDNFAVRHPFLAGVPTLGLWPSSANKRVAGEVASKLMRHNPEYLEDRRKGLAQDYALKSNMGPYHITDRDAESRERVAKITLVGTVAAALGTSTAAIINALKTRPSTVAGTVAGAAERV